MTSEFINKTYMRVELVTAHYVEEDQLEGNKAGYIVDGDLRIPQHSVKDADYFEKHNTPMGDVANKITHGMVKDFITGYADYRTGNTTIVIAKLKNGHTVVTQSSCVDAATYDHALGVSACLKKVEDVVWAGLGFMLACAVHGVNVVYKSDVDYTLATPLV